MPILFGKKKIIGLQNELTKCGILKNMSDDEDFWKLVQEEALGVGTKEKLQKIKLKLMNPRPWPPAASRRRETEMLVSSDQDSGARQGTQVRVSPSMKMHFFNAFFSLLRKKCFMSTTLQSCLFV